MCLEEGEQYAVITQVLGGPNCRATCQDGEVRLCIIRNKFRWRNKSHNRIGPGTWVMVGVRDWETGARGTGPQRCDVLEVYADSDVATIRQANEGTLRVLDLAAQAARPGAPGPQAAQGQVQTEVVFSEEPEADAELIKSTRTEVTVESADVFGADDGSDIDLDEI